MYGCDGASRTLDRRSGRTRDAFVDERALEAGARPAGEDRGRDLERGMVLADGKTRARYTFRLEVEEPELSSHQVGLGIQF